MGAVADDDDAVEMAAAGYGGKMLDLLLGIDGVGFGNNLVVGNAVREEVIATYAAFGLAGILIGAAAEGDDEGGDLLVVEGDCFIETRMQDG